MGLGEPDFSIFKEHLTKVLDGKKLSCPICGTKNWNTEGLSALPTVTLKENDDKIDFTETFPIVLLICQNCFHVHQFAWVPIKEAADVK